ncbi:aspartyl protease family protein [bacterium]|nr:aspartyl protease family protein [bacterium]
MRHILTTIIAIIWAVGLTQPSVKSNELPELLLKHREAMGGVKAIQSITSMRTKIYFSMMILEGNINSITATPDKQWTQMESNVVSFTEASNGSIKWKLDQNEQLTQNEDLHKLKKPAMVLPEFQYLFANDEITIKDLGTEVIDDKTYRILEIDAPGYKKSRKKYLDPKTFLVMREEAEEEGISVIMEYSDYRKFDNVSMPGKTVQQAMMPGIPPSTLTIEELVLNEPVDTSLFNPPAEEIKDYTFPDSHQVTVPMTLCGEHLIVGIKINGKGPYDFVLDSGAAATIIDNSFADELGLERISGMQAVGIGGAESVDKVEVAELSIGDFRIDTLDLYCMDMKILGEMLGLDDNFKGIVGYDLFARAIMKLDYQNQQLTIIDPEHFEYDGPGKPVSGEIVNNLICVNGIIDGDIIGKIRIDTGAAGGLHLHGGYLREHGLLDRYQGDVEMEMYGAGGKQTIQLVKVKTLKLGDFEVKEPLSTLMLSKDGEDGIMGTLDAIATAGNGVLSRFVVFFDYDNNRLILEPSERIGHANRINRAGLVLIEDDQGGIVAGVVMKGSPADKAGFLVGDEIIKFEKLKTGKGLTVDLANKMLFASEGVVFDIKIQREEKTKNLKLILQDLVK